MHLDLQFSEWTLSTYMEEWICKELEKGAPYSSDHLWNRSTYDKRFTLEDAPDTSIWIVDHCCYENREHMRTMLDVGLLENPLFDLQQWYAKIIYDLDAEDHKVDDPPTTGGDDDQGGDPPGGDGNNPGPCKDTDRPDVQSVTDSEAYDGDNDDMNDNDNAGDSHQAACGTSNDPPEHLDTDSNGTLEIFRLWPAARHASAQSAYELRCEC